LIKELGLFIRIDYFCLNCAGRVHFLFTISAVYGLCSPLIFCAWWIPSLFTT